MLRSGMLETQYSLNKSLKTRFLNLFRRVLTIPSIERMIASKSSVSSGNWWKKVVPPDYLYTRGSIRRVEREEVNFELDVGKFLEDGAFVVA